MNDFRPGVAGGGNIGFAFGASTELELHEAQRDEVVNPDGEIWDDNRVALILHVLGRWRAVTGSEARYSIKIHRVNKPHTGLASSAAIQAAMWFGLNFLFGNPFTDHTLRHMIAAAYRESAASLTVKGFTTGLSSFLALYGGFALLDSILTPAFHIQLPSWSAAIVVPRGVRSISFGDVELKALTELGPLLDARDGDVKQKIISEQLLPAASKRDLRELGRAVAALQGLGSKIAEIDIYGESIRAPLDSLRAAFPCAFMSAVGPGLAVVSDISSARLRDGFNKVDFEITWIGSLDNSGMHVMPLDARGEEEP